MLAAEGVGSAVSEYCGITVMITREKLIECGEANYTTAQKERRHWAQSFPEGPPPKLGEGKLYLARIIGERD